MQSSVSFYFKFDIVFPDEKSDIFISYILTFRKIGLNILATIKT